jgi:hypothetical protein
VVSWLVSRLRRALRVPRLGAGIGSRLARGGIRAGRAAGSEELVEVSEVVDIRFCPAVRAGDIGVFW